MNLASRTVDPSGHDLESTYTYNSLNEVLTATDPLSHTTTYGYSPFNQLTSLSGPTSASYVYNGDGLRVSKTVGTTTTDYTGDPTGIGNVLSDGNEYVWGLGLISQIARASIRECHMGAHRWLPVRAQCCT